MGERRCLGCGGKIRADNDKGYCQRTAECRHQRRTVEWAHHKNASGCKCLGCGADLAIDARRACTYTCVACMALGRKLAAMIRSMEESSNGEL